MFKVPHMQSVVQHFSTWIIGLFAVGAEGRVFAYLFIANVFLVREIIGASYVV